MAGEHGLAVRREVLGTRQRDDVPVALNTNENSYAVPPVVVVMIGCIEYAGVNPSAVRPGPPNAWSRCRSTSLLPLPAQTCSGVTSVPLRDR